MSDVASSKSKKLNVQKDLKKPNDVVRFKTSFRNTIYDVMKNRGWKESDTDWDIYWADRDIIYDMFDNMHLENGQKVNHFRNGREVQHNMHSYIRVHFCHFHYANVYTLALS